MYYEINMSTTLGYYEESEAIIDYRGTLTAHTPDGDRHAEIGWFELTHVAIYNSSLMQAESWDLHVVDAALGSLTRYEEEPPLQVWHLKKVVIDAAYRGQGHGTNLIYRLLRHASHAPVWSVFVANASPLNDDGQPLALGTDRSANEVKEKRASLRRLYKRLGFHGLNVLLKGENTPLFYRGLEQALPPPPQTWYNNT